MNNLISIIVVAVVTIGICLSAFFIANGNTPHTKPNTITIRGGASEFVIELTNEELDIIFEDLDEIISRKVVQQ